MCSKPGGGTPSFCRKKISLSLSQLAPEIIGPNGGITIQQILQKLPFDRVSKHFKYVFSLIFNPVISIFSLLLDLFDPFTLLKMYFTTNTRDVYRIENIVSYLYHKTDTGIISKWQINDTFIILIRIELVWDKNNWYFFY